MIERRRGVKRNAVVCAIRVAVYHIDKVVRWWLGRYIFRTRTREVAQRWIDIHHDGRGLNGINMMGVWWDSRTSWNTTKFTTGIMPWEDVWKDLKEYDKKNRP